MDTSISPEDFRKLQIQVDILQRFLTKTFGSSFLEFCKETQLSLTKGNGSSNSKPLPHLNKAQHTPPTKLNASAGGSTKAVPAAVNISTKSTGGNGVTTRRPPPPPLLHRPSGIAEDSKGESKGKSKPETLRVTNVSNGNGKHTPVVEDANGEEDYYFDEANDEDVQLIQPETVFSDEEQGTPSKKSAHDTRNALKRGHSVAFGYNEAGTHDNSNSMHLPEGTECIVINSDEDQGQQDNFSSFHQQDEMYGDLNNGDDMYDEDGYSYSMVDDGLEITGATGEGGNYQTEELQTDGNVTFGSVITAQETGIQYFQCAFCPSAKVFKHKQSLKEHYLLNHSPTPPAFQCQCGRRFLKQSQLKRHEVVHTAERPYVCPICLKDFTRKDNMTVHMVRNHAEKKHACPYCPDKVYATPAEVNRHLRMYHSQWQQ